ncbi:fimbrial protein [Zestomonas carbonaria]|uniref:Laminin-binding fimbrial subunit ElfA n=1 Tax=Zestomonas carbonaria TaxID=2762745 RepID=A0A7U7ESQ6_9GAMM|nr:fimbrial protein [Pseudomonas carbonaria]CAD5110464.1 Laminin-binding fimbrial subunit ElfA [Pseudomonas carbonaria]
MNRQALALAITAVASAPLATAADGTIHFTGNVVSQTCTVAVNGVVSPAVATVTLPTVSASQLDSADKSAGTTSFDIQLKDCAGTATAAAAFFESSNNVDPVSGYLHNADGTASNVALRLIDRASGQVIRAGNANQRTGNTLVNIDASGAANMPYAVEYVALGTSTSGSVVSAVTFSIDYE